MTGHHASPHAQPKKKETKAAPKMVFDVDADGSIYAHDAAGVKVGFKVGTTAWVAVHGKKQGVPLADARLGTIHAGADRTLYEMESVTLAPSETAATAPEKDAGTTHPEVASTGSEVGAATAKTSFTATFSGKRTALLDDGTVVLNKGKSWEPVAPDALPPAIQGKLDEKARIELGDGSLWVWMSFALKDEKADKARWVPPGHSKSEVQSSQSNIDAEAKKLPAASAVKTAIDGYIRTIALVSSVEGNFGSVSPGDDTYASLGIFQWAMPKNSSSEAGSLGMFFGNLKERAEAAEKKPEKDRTDEDKLYIASWGQCRAHNLDVSGKQILLNGKPATGGEVESEMRGEMAKGDLRTYQLVAAKDWIEQFKGTIVRPGPVGAGIIGHGYSERGDGATIKLKSGEDTYSFTADSYATVGSLFSSEHAIATAVMLGVNRPHYVETSLWRALNPKADPKADTEAALAKLAAALAPKETAPATAPVEEPKPKAKTKGKAKPKGKSFGAAEVEAAGPDAKAAYADLKAMLWPNKTLDADAQTKLEAEFKKQAMKLYNPSDARKYHRERRFSTVEAANW